MLKFISSPAISREKVTFNKDLSVVVGPSDGTNSIGKSSFLLLIDFAFGGESLLKSDANILEHVGNFELSLGFEFDSTEQLFIREIANPNKVKKWIGDKYIEITLEEFKQYLCKNYGFDEYFPSFRQTVGPFTRVYGRGTDNPNAPLAARLGEAKREGTAVLLKIFRKYKLIAAFDIKKAEIEERISNIKSAFKTDVVKQLKKKELKDAELELKNTQKHIGVIKSSLDDSTINYNNLLSDINLKRQEGIDSLMRDKRSFESQLSRVDRNLSLSSKVNKRHFNRLVEFFPGVNESRLEQIENFHGKVSQYLKKDINEEKEQLGEGITEVIGAAEALRDKIRSSTNASSSTGQLVDELLSEHLKVTNLQNQINFNYASNSAVDEKKHIAEESKDILISCLGDIQAEVNELLSEYIAIFYSEGSAVPTLSFNKDSYTFSHGKDIGTGKSYANMISLDLTLLNKTALPYLIHDTIVFKQIQVLATENIINEYIGQSKQVFIALDEITRFSIETQNKIISKRVIELTYEKPAFKKIWGTRDTVSH
ncbi:hypothetical protein CXF86_13940 [Shewanella sp. GutCb]|uniref:DUF2326 domain-containing protein n=1 Tax=Shewanella sp. GutCb TaxID=2058315 RepID=UPI000C7ADB27|nr:DUF2326 domain-containing protein [Shewanella sp. GutCb]PKG74219.1 hypothetical protein CXF86_13940 [Shewanella sp. GutCb]